MAALRAALVTQAGVTLMAALACTDSTQLEQEAAKDREGGHHCLSPWDGNHDGFESQIRALRNDPGSMKTQSTTTSRMIAGSGTHRINMDYSPKHALAGVIRTAATGYLDPDTCVDELLCRRNIRDVDMIGQMEGLAHRVFGKRPMYSVLVS